MSISHLVDIYCNFWDVSYFSLVHDYKNAIHNFSTCQSLIQFTFFHRLNFFILIIWIYHMCSYIYYKTWLITLYNLITHNIKILSYHDLTISGIGKEESERMCKKRASSIPIYRYYYHMKREKHICPSYTKRNDPW